MATAGQTRRLIPGEHHAPALASVPIRHDWQVAEALEALLLHADLEVKCRKCEYPIWVTGAEFAAGAAVTCPCCRTRSWMIDANGQFLHFGRDIEQQIDQALRGLRR